MAPQVFMLLAHMVPASMETRRIVTFIGACCRWGAAPVGFHSAGVA